MDYKSACSDYSDCSDEDIGLRKKAFVTDLPADFDPHKIPQSGEEYLQHVMYEAKRCPRFVAAPLDESKRKPISKEVSIKANCLKAPKHMVPTKQWQADTIREFLKFRKFLLKDAQENSDLTFTEASLKQMVTTGFPKHSVVMRMSQQDKLEAFNILAEMLTEEAMSKQCSVWIFSLLATLETPLCPNTCDFLREFARKCATIRSELSPDAVEERYVSLNLFICIIARFYGQLDLADE